MDPVRVALAQAAPVLPTGPGWWYEPKFDGHRAIMHRGLDGARLQSRSGRDITSRWLDVALAGMELLPGTVLDGELVIWNGGRLDFGAVQSRAASTPARARRLAEDLPGSYAVWDCIEHPAHGDVRGRPYVERRRLLLDVLAEIGPPIQAVPASDDITTALDWYASLRSIGIEGVVAKRASSPYRPSRIWVKVRHSEPVDSLVVGVTGPRSRPWALVVELPDGRRALSQRLTAQLSASAAALLAGEEPRPLKRTRDGERYTPVGGSLAAEVLAGSTRHRVVTVTRLRPAETD
ncbi:ATP-dependent DNA ligase [Streptomyces pseudovenezuelae]|uniref:ATP-dependent DNA ligase n=1 Tax=Streptomyces pseudovenezuelae TaxID=67350 RepID=UPI0036E1BD25